MHDPIRGDVPHHQLYTPGVDVEEDLLGVPSFHGGRNGVGRVMVSRPRSVLSPTERTVVGDGHPPGPGSRLVSPELDAPPVSVYPRTRLRDLNAHLAEREDSSRQVAANY